LPSLRTFLNSRQAKKWFKDFNADFVETIDVLKEKNATEKYGTLGKYGVIIFNMKEGAYDSLPRKLKRGCR
jgi:hypothetical protein